ncbi:NERD domain-containing protein [Paradevosia shaoguanensis]|uniref:NERD domain-containing protein n=1 Tax=Paradevosia shaoguanensis TaxID=1335043 RepID=UPI0019340600|nr:NERD domain-containing protein [Paradevosia shaoguanensis]
MPAYRSSAEAEVRDAVVERLRLIRPQARIIHEINVSTYGPNRIDVLAVSPAEIVAVEVKSARDKLDRLPSQIKSMMGCAHHVVAALHEKFLVERETGVHAAHYQRDGRYYFRDLPENTGIRHPVLAWIFPEKRRAMKSVVEGGVDYTAYWSQPDQTYEETLPAAALEILWRDELAELCGSLGVPSGRRSNMSDMARALRWHCSGKELTKGICSALRARRCVEADPEIEAAA